MNVPGLDLTLRFAAGEELRTEISAKFRRRRAVDRAGRRRAASAALVHGSGRRLRADGGGADEQRIEHDVLLRPVDDRAPRRPARRRGPDRAVDARRQPDEVAPRPHDVVLRDVRARRARRRLPAVRRAVPVPVQLLLRGRRAAARPAGAGPHHPSGHRGGRRLPRARRRGDGGAARWRRPARAAASWSSSGCTTSSSIRSCW